MGSLNGDVVVMRNGRSTSQVSIYNYPEHLNPFYEDEQHKRLRFWKISKKDGEGRRNSFSIGNLRDMWSFKSFSLKKKSSTLGINKTSESPPPLRREINVDNGWNSFDHRLRGSATSSINGDSFQRNATYRSSLQNLPSTNDRFGFNRNDDYRSTIQVPRANPRYNPQQQKPYVKPRRSSQSSMVSTNPFESDVDDDNEDVNALQSVNGGSTSTLSKATPRKKRRAPAPPTPSEKSSMAPAIVIKSSQDDLPNDELCIREDTDIANLTAEIESFVKNKNNDDIGPVVKKETKIRETSSDGNASRADTEKTVIKTTTVISTTTTNPKPEPVDNTKNVSTSKDGTTEDGIKHPTPNKDNNITTTTTSTANDQKSVQQISNTTITISTQKNNDTKLVLQDETKATAQATPIAEIHADKATSVAETQAMAPKAVGETETKSVEQNVTTTHTGNTTSKPVNGHVVSAVETEKKVIMSNGAIPKKPKNSEDQITSTQVESVQLKIEEPQEQVHKPLPAQRSAKNETEVGHVECIHVHVESPRATPREHHPSKVTSFKNEHEVITTKTPFVLTSPPRQRKAPENTELTKETTKLVQSPKATVTNDLQIQEEPRKPSPEIREKPALSPKPMVERVGQSHSFAEIHKPMRNVHARRPSRDEIVPPPPSVPSQQSLPKETVVDSSTSQVVGEQKQTPEAAVQVVEAQTKDRQSELPTFASSSTRITNSAEDGTGNDSAQFDALYRPRTQMEWKRSTLAPLETNIPPEKRKSVKDIIESINRSQRLLHAAANKDFTIVSGPQTASTNVDSSNENLRIIDESQREIRRMVNQMEHRDRSNGTSTFNGSNPSSVSPPPSYSECIASQKLDNGEIFQKCTVKKEVYDYRESSPISSNLDWNPVPKPKRTKPQNE
ncbi:probable serine/threonine-protein kinase kinX isoform X2 [Musca domestica]|uniref:Probable serine/threonine-protein kinase kinX n=1 Tax=Musca domestica TaxID=7370 RepID=A0A1I8MEU7_MUSDO|nr:probable serine/threonine-protein kinase kinX isoform X2 [Musca domestica]